MTKTATVRVLEAVKGSITDAKEGKFKIKIIAPGWGSSGYYAEEVLKRDGAATWPAGTQSYLNHESLDEMWTRPERTVEEICGYLGTDAEWVEESKEDWFDGKGLYSELDVFPSQVEFITERMNHVGMSIRAYAEGEYGEKDGRYGHIITKFVEGVSVDVVTMAGAGGKIVSVLESKQLSAEDKPFVQRMINEMRTRGTQIGLTDKDRALLEQLSGKSFPVTLIEENKKGYVMTELSEETGKSLVAAVEALTEKLTAAPPAAVEPKKESTGPSAVEIGKALATSGLTDKAQDKVVEAVGAGADLAATIKEYQELTGVKSGAAQEAPNPYAGFGVVTEAAGAAGDSRTTAYEAATKRWGSFGAPRKVGA